MWNKSKMQAQALDVALLEEAAEMRRAEKMARAKDQTVADAGRRERVLEISAWEDAGLVWLKEGKSIFGPTFDFQAELRRLAQNYAESHRLPYEDLTDLGANVDAGVRTAFTHGLFALLLSFIAVVSGTPVWVCAIASASYLVWRFLARRSWLIQQRTVAHTVRSEDFVPRTDNKAGKISN